MLKILGVVFLVIIGLVIAFAAWLAVRFRQGIQQQRHVSAIEEGMDTPAIVLEPTDDPSLVSADAVAELLAQADRAGAIRCGAFDAPAAGARLLAYSLKDPPVYIVIYDHDQVEPWIDVLLRLDEERSFTVSTVPEIGRGAPRPPEDEIDYFAPGTELGVLVRVASDRADGEAPLPAIPGEFRNVFEAAAEKSRKFIQTQTVSQEWLASIAEDAGIELTGGEAEQINLGRESQRLMQTESECLQSLAESGDFTAAKWNELRDSLVVVWDEMPDEFVSSVFYNNVDVPMELEDEIEDLEQPVGTVRERVARFNSKLPANLRLIPVGSVSSPVAADIYRSQVPVV